MITDTIYFKIYFTLLFVVLAIAGSSWLLMNSDDKRSDLWYKISKISLITLATMIIGVALTTIWFYD
jgi:cytochrome bd-type quinol oxidase subunit 2